MKTAQPADPVRVVAAGDALIAPAVTRRLIAEFAKRRSLRVRDRVQAVVLAYECGLVAARVS